MLLPLSSKIDVDWISKLCLHRICILNRSVSKAKLDTSATEVVWRFVCRAAAGDGASDLRAAALPSTRPTANSNHAAPPPQPSTVSLSLLHSPAFVDSPPTQTPPPPPTTTRTSVLAKSTSSVAPARLSARHFPLPCPPAPD